MTAVKKESARHLKKHTRPQLREEKAVCINKDCKLRKGGCKGFEGCPGYKTI
ncbi:hypothetical protein [Candidatus Magnetominusculus xianensis]|uniref:Uncharacterized protein n=1 Tax=Candidatus Magnetominusculus xianensis TaxID=1748249 RepID=A0ABR5SGQ1_9BACT|nr:hypothetical protein [Candidatus Magnetominusculus xianensis]KWT82476.1 hypothetical protein ASN18_2508 [Candidatus Magnetominusculus xianensis]MBF0403196.1 hypothetical protein [Nitrospirota bacterium]